MDNIITLADGRRVLDPMDVYGAWADAQGYTDADFEEDLPAITAAWEAHLDGEAATGSLFAAEETVGE